LQAIEAGAAFRALAERHGAAEITEIRRQREDWQRDATKALATGRTGEAVHAYEAHGMVQAADTREAARAELIDTWDAQRRTDPDQTRIILTHTNAEVRDLNLAARDRLRDAGELGADVGVSAERGAREFASGDRIMFLKNERGLGVKNGTLGEVERVSPDSMAVKLDDGRQIAFDLKDYAHVDHGYAATFHKSQGVTVDQAHVLATPGMDRHSAYVGLSRHRDGMQLHYGRDDFADQRQLTRTLSRERAKDMAGDYARPEQDQARAFADRREIRFPERAREMVRQVQAKAKGMFAGFRPKPASPELAGRDGKEGPINTAPERGSTAPNQAKAIERYARAQADMDRMRDKGLPVLPHQQAALAKAGDALDKVRPHGARDLASAFERNPALVREAAEGKPGGAARAMAEEGRVRINPERRADRFVERWQSMARERAELVRSGDRAGAERTGKKMESVAGTLHRDPELESVLRRRAPELGLEMRRDRAIEQELTRSLEIGRDRGMSR